jgi:hypothetical protein
MCKSAYEKLVREDIAWLVDDGRKQSTLFGRKTSTGHSDMFCVSSVWREDGGFMPKSIL